VLRKHLHAIVAVLIFAVVCAGSAGAKTLINGGKQIKSKSITGSRLKSKSVTCDKTKGNLARLCKQAGTLLAQTPAEARPGAAGPQGPQGAQGAQGGKGDKGDKGDKGEKGDKGDQGAEGTAKYVGPQWGTILRNVIQGGMSDLKAARYAGQAPPFGDGALEINVPSSSAKSDFGNETDFVGNPVSGLTQVGYRVHTTGENNSLGNPNMPSITFEIDPKGAGGTTTTFSSLVWVPSANSAANQWSPYIDATTDGFWGLTGGQFNTPATQANCGLNGPRCTFAQIQTFLATGSGATIYNVQISKGRDYAWTGAVDGLRINNQVFDFEPFGVRTLAP
jgi:Collagen triple helix repeat (20 copies)